MDAAKTMIQRRKEELSEPLSNRLISVDENVTTVVAPKRFRSGRVGWFGQQKTMIDGEKVHIQVLIIKDDITP